MEGRGIDFQLPESLGVRNEKVVRKALVFSEVVQQYVLKHASLFYDMSHYNLNGVKRQVSPHKKNNNSNKN